MVAYGAAAKGNTLLNYAGVTADLIEYAVDRNPAKQDTLLPGTKIPVHDVDMLEVGTPDDILILPWNIREEILERNQGYRDAGGRFIVAIPEVQVI